MTTRLIISGELFQILKMEISDEDFKKYSTNGFPQEDEDDDYEDFIEQISDADGDSGLTCNESSYLSLYVNGDEIKDFSKNFRTEFETEVFSITKWQSGKNYVVQTQFGADANWELEIEDEFDKDKLTFHVHSYELPDKTVIHELIPFYDDEEFEYEDGFGFTESELYLVDKEGKIQNN